MLTDDAQMDLNNLKKPEGSEKSEAQRQVIDIATFAIALNCGQNCQAHMCVGRRTDGQKVCAYFAA